MGGRGSKLTSFWLVPDRSSESFRFLPVVFTPDWDAGGSSSGASAYKDSSVRVAALTPRRWSNCSWLSRSLVSASTGWQYRLMISQGWKKGTKKALSMEGCRLNFGAGGLTQRLRHPGVLRSPPQPANREPGVGCGKGGWTAESRNHIL